MVYMALCHHKLLPFVDEKNHNFYDVLSLNRVILIRTVFKLIHNVKYHNVFCQF